MAQPQSSILVCEGPLAALNAADTVVYAAAPTGDGVDGVVGARMTAERFRKSRERIGAATNIMEAGIVVGGVKETIMSRPATASIDELRETGLLLTRLIAPGPNTLQKRNLELVCDPTEDSCDNSFNPRSSSRWRLGLHKRAPPAWSDAHQRSYPFSFTNRSKRQR